MRHISAKNVRKVFLPTFYQQCGAFASRHNNETSTPSINNKLNHHHS